MFNKIRKRLKWRFSSEFILKKFLRYMRIEETDDIEEEFEEFQRVCYRRRDLEIDLEEIKPDPEAEKPLREYLKEFLTEEPDEPQESSQKEYRLEDKSISLAERRRERRPRKVETDVEEMVSAGKVYDYTGYRVLPLFRLEQMLESKENKFSDTLLEYIDQSGMKDSEVYKKAEVDRKHFSKIRKNKDYTPKKTTVISFAIALELSISDTERLLKSAGYSLSNSYELDIAIRFFLQKRYYDRHRINELLYQYGIETL